MFWVIQGDPNQNFRFRIEIAQDLCISDPKLVKPKCVSGVADFFSFQLFVYNFQLFVYNFLKNPPLLKHILALPTWGQECIDPEIFQFEIKHFDLGHPVDRYFCSGLCEIVQDALFK